MMTNGHKTGNSNCRWRARASDRIGNSSCRRPGIIVVVHQAVCVRRLSRELKSPGQLHNRTQFQADFLSSASTSD